MIDCIRRSDIGLTDFDIIMCKGDYREALKILLEKIASAPSVKPIEIDILNNLRNEIKELPYQQLFGHVSNYSLLDTVIEIIDKYRNEVSQ